MPEQETPGRAFVFGDNVDTDQIIPARYLVTGDRAELGTHCMEDADSTFAASVRPGDVIVAGRNFGCGSSREHAPLSILGAGVRSVVAASFARIFFRNAINVGLSVLECPEAASAITSGDELQIDTSTGAIHNRTSGEHYQALPLPEVAREIVAAGGLMNAVAARAGLTPRQEVE